MIEANKVIFSHLDDYAKRIGCDLPNFGSSRWIATDEADRRFLKEIEFRESLRFGNGKSLHHAVYKDASYVFLIGFSDGFESDLLIEYDVNAAQFTAILSEALPTPTATASELLEIVGAFDKEGDSDYNGHDAVLISGLFPRIRMLHQPQGIVGAPWSCFFSICLSEASVSGHWIDIDLLKSLRTIAELDPEKIPYRVLARSIFDVDEASFFLALYRCLEALYSYSATTKLISELKLAHEWREVAGALERSLGWYPREDASIEKLFLLAGEREINEIQRVLNVDKEPQATFRSRVARSIYALRNQIVHFRPMHQALDTAGVDWNALCDAMACIVLDVYDATLSPQIAARG